MKKLIAGFLMTVGIFASMATPAFASFSHEEPTYPSPAEIVCVENEANIVDNQTFEQGKLIKITYRWHVVTQTETEVTYQLQFDIDPRGGHESWVNVNGQTRVLEIPDCTPVQPEPEQEPVVVTYTEPSPAGAPTCDGVPFVALPANVFFTRTGLAENAQVNWVPTQGSQAEIYFRAVGNSADAHADRDIANSGNDTIHLLRGIEYEFGVQQKDGCAFSDIVWARLVK